MVILVNVDLPMTLMEHYNEQDNLDQLWANLNLLEQIREWAQIKIISYQQWIAQYHKHPSQVKDFPT